MVLRNVSVGAQLGGVRNEAKSEFQEAICPPPRRGGEQVTPASFPFLGIKCCQVINFSVGPSQTHQS